MKNFVVTLLAALALGLSACKKETETVNPTPPGKPVVGQVRPTGTSLGPVVTKQIGPDGGSLQSADGTFTITVPAGALTAATEISIEPITSTCKGSVGHGWRLAPHGKAFAKPVQLTVDYSAHRDSLSAADALGLAYQNDKGIWQFLGASAIDKTNRTVTQSTDHFSDWTLLQWMTLSPISSQLLEKEDVTLTALTYISLPSLEDDLVVPLRPIPQHPEYKDGYPVGEPEPLPAEYVGEWSHAGPGTLISSGHEAMYAAPEMIASTQVVAVTLTLKGFKGKAMLVSNVMLLGKEPVVEYLEVAERDGFQERESVLTIYGTGFGPEEPGKSVVTINGEPVLGNLLWGDNIIVCTIRRTGPNASGQVEVTNAAGAVSKPHILNEWNVVMRLEHPHAAKDQSLFLRSTFYLRIRGDTTVPPANLNIIGKNRRNTVHFTSFVRWEAGGTGSSVLNNEEACGKEYEEWTASQGDVTLTPNGKSTDDEYFNVDLYLVPGKGFDVSLDYHARNVIQSRFTFTACGPPPYTTVDNRPVTAHFASEFGEERFPLRFNGSTLKAGASKIHRTGIGSMKLHTNGSDPNYMKDIQLVWNAAPAKY
ncbi:MAG: IPT/TIG domain-containing protein [Cytophagales bacterium]|nr:IPT/TIG domain-containing protein [Cytophagales bacterium]